MIEWLQSDWSPAEWAVWLMFWLGLGYYGSASFSHIQHKRRLKKLDRTLGGALTKAWEERFK